ncbi:hypothetical protein CYMTET_5205 [Cymbomonas tetramitiformis]|uniref:Reverse transcriptase domain-containing protein n=1 Tax=Cymbomonas tetramitiformis TaxID=36881 RepID=A0AAE0GZV4_9CHLO|nr:hypothetical protein CYMTET_5205 [Cymbomonas tetramitiformis]
MKWLRQPPPRFDHGVSLLDATPLQQIWLDKEKARALGTGAWGRATKRQHVSRAFLVKKPGENKWRLVVDFRWMNSFCVKSKVKMETLKKLCRLAEPNDWCFSFDLQDGYHAVGIDPDFQKYMQFDLQGELFQCTALPFGWSDAPRIFVKFMKVLVEALRWPGAAEDRRELLKLKNGRVAAPRYEVRRRAGGVHRDLRRRGARVLPYMDDFLILTSTEEEAFVQRERVRRVLARLGLTQNEKKGQWEPGQIIEHAPRSGGEEVAVGKTAGSLQWAVPVDLPCGTGGETVPSRAIFRALDQAELGGESKADATVTPRYGVVASTAGDELVERKKNMEESDEGETPHGQLPVCLGWCVEP